MHSCLILMLQANNVGFRCSNKKGVQTYHSPKNNSLTTKLVFFNRTILPIINY